MTRIAVLLPAIIPLEPIFTRTLQLVTVTFQIGEWAVCLRNHIAKHSSKLKGLLVLAGLLGILMFVCPFLIEDIVYVEKWKFWIQTIAGNWSAEPYPNQPQYHFAISAVLAILLNNGIIILIVTFTWNVITKERKKIMNLAQTLKSRDAIVIATIQSIFLKAADLSDKQRLEAIRDVTVAFQRGTEEWAQKYLPLAVGPKSAEEIRALLTQNVADPDDNAARSAPGMNR